MHSSGGSPDRVHGACLPPAFKVPHESGLQLPEDEEARARLLVHRQRRVKAARKHKKLPPALLRTGSTRERRPKSCAGSPAEPPRGPAAHLQHLALPVHHPAPRLQHGAVCARQAVVVCQHIPDALRGHRRAQTALHRVAPALWRTRSKLDTGVQSRAPPCQVCVAALCENLSCSKFWQGDILGCTDC
jgi:hypothetical protein